VTENIQTVFGRALSAHQSGNLDIAERLYRDVLALDKRQAAPLQLLGVIHGQRGNTEEGIRCIEKSLKIDPQSPEAWLNLGRLQGESGDLASAEKSLRRSAEINPNNPLALSNLVIVLRRLGRHDDALACSDRSLALAPGNPMLQINRGNVLLDLGRFEDAANVYRVAAAHDASLADAWLGLGSAEAEAGRSEEAIVALERALTLDPTSAKAQAGILKVKLDACSWNGIGGYAARCLVNIENSAVGSAAILALPTTPEQQYVWAKRNSTERFGHISATPVSAQTRPKIRVGYFSADFRDHATSHLVVGTFEQHDRSRFEIIGVSHGLNDDSAIRDRVVTAFDNFADIHGMNTDDAICHIRSLELDIAVNLMGLTHQARNDLFAHRVAPVQVSYLGYPGTMGAPFMDYIVADNTVIPDVHEEFYAEKIARLPGSYQPNDNKRSIAEGTVKRADHGLPMEGFVFCCFNAPYKITPQIFDIWMRLLSSVDGSALWLFEKTSTVAANLRKEAEARGIAANRLVFAPRMPQAEHLARHGAADLFLDTIPCNAHTTASDALWAGLPVLTCEGHSFPGRVAASLLRAIEMPELITTSLEEYEALALKLARDPALLAATKDKLARNRLTTPLFDTVSYTRHLESTYKAMHERALRGKPPASFSTQV
jgi:protein O-GlcNAc transferase